MKNILSAFDRLTKAEKNITDKKELRQEKILFWCFALMPVLACFLTMAIRKIFPMGHWDILVLIVTLVLGLLIVSWRIDVFLKKIEK